MQAKNLKLIKGTSKAGDSLAARILKSYFQGQLPSSLGRFIREEPMLLPNGVIETVTFANLPHKLSRKDREALNALPRHNSIRNNLSIYSNYAQSCTIADAVSVLVITGKWRDLKLEDYLNPEGAMLLARDLSKRSKHLIKTKNNSFSVISSTRLWEKLVAELKKAKIQVHIPDLHIPWPKYFAIKEIYAMSPNLYAEQGKGLDRLASAVAKKGIEIAHDRLVSVRNVIRDSLSNQPV